MFHSYLRRTFAPGAVLAVCLYTAGCAKHEASSVHAANLPRAAVATATIHDLTDTLPTIGEFLPYQEVELHAKIAGYIKTIHVDIGDRVHKGEVLAVLEVPELNAQLQGAGASVLRSEEEISRAKHELARAEADHESLHAAAERLQQAAKARAGLIAEQELDDALAKDRASEAQVQAASSALSSAERGLDVSKASEQQVSAMSDYSRIVAPFDGVVTWRYADTGALVQSGTSNSNSEPVVKIAQIDMLRLRIPVPEAVAASVKLGDEADVKVQATGEHFRGKVSRMTDAFDRATRAEQVEIDVPNRSYQLSPGMYAEVSLDTRGKQGALTVPIEALRHDGNRASVLLVDSDNRVVDRTVTVGMQTPERVEIVSGLRAGDQVMVGNLNAFQAGDMVVPTKSVLAGAQQGGAE